MGFELEIQESTVREETTCKLCWFPLAVGDECHWIVPRHEDPDGPNAVDGPFCGYACADRSFEKLKEEISE